MVMYPFLEEIRGFCSCVAEEASLLDCSVVLLGKQFLMFQTKVVPSHAGSSGRRHCFTVKVRWVSHICIVWVIPVVSRL